MTPLRLVLALICITAAALIGQPEAGVAAALLGGLAAALLLGSRHQAVLAPPEPARPPLADDRLIDALEDPLLVVERRIVVRANAAARRLLGQHIVGQDARLAIRAPSAAAHLGQAPAHVRGIALEDLGGRDGRWEMDLAPLDDEVRLVHLVDRSAAHAAEAMRVDFVANASHELRTPLSTLIGFLETLAEDSKVDAPTRRRFLGIMQGEAKRMRQLIEDLISLSRIEGERHRLPETPLALGPVVARVAEEIRVAASEPPDIFRLALAEDLPPVAGDEAQLVQLLHNILGNAVKYRRPGTPVTVSLQPVSGTVVLKVVDQGDGIAPEHLPRLTERFYRVDAGRSRSVGGTGLGLAIVKHIVERHRGRLDVASELGTGTTVTIALPLSLPPMSLKSHEAVIEGGASASRAIEGTTE